MSETNRMHIRERVEAGLARQEQREQSALARSGAAARDKMTQVAREHPMLLVAGGLVVGALLSTLVPRSPTRKMSKGALGFMAMVAELGIAYGKQAMDAAEGASESSREQIGEWSGKVVDGAAKLRDRVKAAVED